MLDEWARSGGAVTTRNNSRLGPNQLLWDLGVDDVLNQSLVEKKIQEMENHFHLVMILEHFEVELN